ncbi:MAG: TIGR03619 family F420-dependent LLM class oxidoreductase [Myxococcota bacterium]
MKFCTSLAFSDPTQFCDLARTADAAGWEALIVSDHVVHPQTIGSPYPYTANNEPRWESQAPWPDPWVAIAAMAAVTERLRFLTGIYVLPMRNPFVVAKALGTAAVMSNNRISLGLGVGWMKEEFDLLGESFRNRGRRADEMIDVLRKLWTGGMVEHHGEFYDFAPLRMSPAVEGEIPLIVGGLSEPALRRAARIGDGWISDIHTTEELAAIVAKLDAFRAEYGREQRPFQVIAAAKDAFDVDGFKRLEGAGVTHVQTMPWALYEGSGDTLAEKQEGLERFADEIIAKMD